NRTKQPRYGKERVRRIKVHMVKGIEHLAPKLKSHSFLPDGPILLDAEVPIVEAGARRFGMVRGTLPKVKGAGCANAPVLNQRSMVGLDTCGSTANRPLPP